MVHGVLARTMDPALKAAQLPQQPLVIGDGDSTTIEDGQRLEIEGRLRKRAALVPHACIGETCTDPFAREVVADDLADAVVSGEGSVLLGHGPWVERRQPSPNHISDERLRALLAFKDKSPAINGNGDCVRCKRTLLEIDHYGERLVGCADCNRWSWRGSDRLFMQLPDQDIAALKTIRDASERLAMVGKRVLFNDEMSEAIIAVERQRNFSAARRRGL
jgi:hypothetical protein